MRFVQKTMGFETATTNDQRRRADQIGKIFVALSQDMRQCLICDGVFTKQGSAAHADAACHPPKGNSELDGENQYANR